MAFPNPARLLIGWLNTPRLFYAYVVRVQGYSHLSSGQWLIIGPRTSPSRISAPKLVHFGKS